MIDLNEAKRQVGLTDSQSAHDAYLTSLIGAAIEAAELYCGADFSASMPASVKQGCLMFIATLFQNRADVGSEKLQAVPLTVERLWGANRTTAGVY